MDMSEMVIIKDPKVNAILVRQVRQYYVRYNSTIYVALIDEDEGNSIVNKFVYLNNEPVTDDGVRNAVLELVKDEEARIEKSLVEAYLKVSELQDVPN